MKKLGKIIVSVLVIAIFATALVACKTSGETGKDGNGTATGNSGTTVTSVVTTDSAAGNNGGSESGTTPKQKANELYKSDEAMLKDKGYTVYDYSYNCAYEGGKFGAESGDILRYMYAYDDDGNNIRIYYCKSEEIASSGAAYIMNDPDHYYEYKAVGIRIVREDPQNLIHD